MKVFKLYSWYAFIIVIIACGKSGSQKELREREQQVSSKEKQLLSLEHRLKLKEQELIKREQQIDSLETRSDSVGVYNPKFIGDWTVTMECIETSCEGSAIGDTKTEQWHISYQNNTVIAKAEVNKTLIRTYTGLVKENSLILVAKQTPETGTHMDVTLSPHPTTDKLMEGQRVINQGGKCRIVYAIKAEKI